MSGEQPNRLIEEQSPYLRQHAHNPVDWYPWGSEALDRARAEDKPILLSIGYSACHWCHVMERESFENPAIAALMNRDFVNIKVDREERPDIDAIYMNTVQMLTGAGGWPLTVFLTPEGKPFYGGTYFPPEDRYGRPGFPRVLQSVAQAWRQSRSEVDQNVDALMGGLARLSAFEASASGPSRETVVRAQETLLPHVDGVHGGIGSPPKFPNVPVFRLFLRGHRSAPGAKLLEAVRITLTSMARGGIYDQLGGGFHRYSVDGEWLVPHFEKMLYDNAQLVPLYLDAFRVTSEPLYRRVAAETLEYLLREMTHPQGGFFSTQDADTEGEEGKTYLWRIEEIQQLLGAEDAEIVCRYYQVDEVGNFAEPGHNERKSILNVKLGVGELARLFKRDVKEIEGILERGRATLLRAREARPQPGRDEKVLTSWNALAIRAFVHGANVLAEPRYLDAARRAARFLDLQLTTVEGRLLRSWKDGVAKYAAYLDDYAFLAAARLDLFEATGDPEDLAAATRLCETLADRFADPASGGFFFTADDHEELIDRPKLLFDGSLPSGNAVAVETLLRLAHRSGVARNRELAGAALRLFGEQMERQPFGTAYLIGALDDSLVSATDIVVVGSPGDDRTKALLHAAHSVYLPGKSVLAVDPADESRYRPEALRSARFGSEPAAYVCHDFTCSLPVSEPRALVSLLG